MDGKRNGSLIKNKAGAALICCAVLFLSFLSGCFGAAAMNVDYMNPDKWSQNGNVKRISLDCTNVDRTLKGDFYYLTDGNLCLYTYFKITETSLSAKDDNVFVIYNVHTPDEEYEIYLDESGFYDESPEQERSLFSVKSSFASTGQYISAIQYTAKGLESCTVDVSINVNGKIYRITENKDICGKPIYMELTTTTKQQTTKKEAQTQKKKSGKKKTAATKKETAKKETTTKFHPGYSITTTAKSKQKSESESKPEEEVSTPESAAVTEAVSETYEYLGDTEQKPQMSSFAKWMLIIAAILAAAGLGVTVTALAMKKDEETPKEDE